MTKGDSISVIPKEGAPGSIEASKSGRTVEYAFDNEGGIKWLTLREVTRGGTTVKEVRVATSEVVSFTVNKKEIA